MKGHRQDANGTIRIKSNSGLHADNQIHSQSVTYTTVDEDGGKKVCGDNNKLPDHSTIITNIKINYPRKKPSLNMGGSKKIQDIDKQTELGSIEHE